MGRVMLNNMGLTYEDLLEMGGISDTKINAILRDGMEANNADGSPNYLARAKFMELVGKFSHRFIERHHVEIDHTYIPDDTERAVLQHIQSGLLSTLPGAVMIEHKREEIVDIEAEDEEGLSTSSDMARP